MPARSPRPGARRSIQGGVALVTALTFAASSGAQTHAFAGARSAAPRLVRPTWGPDGTIMATLQRIHGSLRTSRYAHSTSVDERAGRYEFDCSGMTAWVLSRAAPEAHRGLRARIGSSRPLARDFYQLIAATPAGRVSGGWSRVGRVADAQPGDVLAWLRPRVVQSANTGHVGFVVAPPEPVDGVPNAYLVRFADASSYQHQDDSRAGTGRTGFGFGTILVMADPQSGAPAAYGWFGRYSQWVLATSMAIGRPAR